MVQQNLFLVLVCSALPMILGGSPLLCSGFCAVGSAPVALQNKPVGQHTVRWGRGGGGAWRRLTSEAVGDLRLWKTASQYGLISSGSSVEAGSQKTKIGLGQVLVLL